MRSIGAARALVAVLGTFTVLAVLTAGVASARLGWTWADTLDAFVLSNAVMGLAFGGCGAILAWHRPGNPIGWLFLGGGLLQAISAASPPVSSTLETAGTWTPLVRLSETAFVYAWPWAIGLCIPLALLLFPDGRPASRPWRWVVLAVVVSAPLFVLEMGSAPVPADPDGPLGYLTLPYYDQLGPLWLGTEIRTLAAYLLAVLALALRYRRGSETTRQQLLWLLAALVVVVVALIPWGLVAGTPVAVLFSIPLIPIAVTVAVVRHRLLDIRLVLSRALTWLLLTLLVIVGYAVLVALLDRLVSTYLSRSALATVLLVLFAAPLLPRLQRLVDRAMYGERANPTRVVLDLGQQLSTPASGLAGVAVTIRHALRLPYVALERGEEILAAEGTAPELLVREPLSYGGEPVGRLAVGLRPGERRLADPDRQVLALLAAPLAVAVHATVISAELQSSRERIVAAREEERRRLRRALHDGLGPALTGIAFAADAAANLVQDPDRAGALLDTLRRDTRAALTDVRRVVEDLRPPELDELGLVGALQRRAEQFGRRPNGAAVDVQLDVPRQVPALPAAVEVAAYRIATEALTNVARHSTAERAVVRLRFGDRLEVAVRDDGRTRQAWTPGVGLQSMSERAAELGGELTAGPSPDGGRVSATLPMIAR